MEEFREARSGRGYTDLEDAIFDEPRGAGVKRTYHTVNGRVVAETASGVQTGPAYSMTFYTGLAIVSSASPGRSEDHRIKEMKQHRPNLRSTLSCLCLLCLSLGGVLSASAQRIGSESEIESLFKAYRSANADQRAEIETNLRLNAPRREFLERKLGSGILSDRILATSLLATFGNESSLPALRAQLTHADSNLRCLSLTTIGILDRESGLLEARRLTNDPAAGVRAEAIRIIGLCERREDWPLLVEAFSDQNATVRAAAVSNARAPVDDPAPKAVLWQKFHSAMRDRAVRVRSALCLRLSNEPDEAALMMLQLLAARDRSQQIRDQAVWSLDTWYRRFLDRGDRTAIKA